MARTALKSGIVPGSLVATYINDTILHAALILGLMHAGANTLSLRGPKPIMEIVPDVILTDVPGAFLGQPTVLAVDQRWLEGEGGAAPMLAYDDDNAVCRTILTSGSTGVPKGIAFTQSNLLSRIAHYSYSKGPRFSHCSRFFCDLGISTSPGFRYMMCLLSRGGTIFFLGPDPAGHSPDHRSLW